MRPDDTSPHAWWPGASSSGFTPVDPRKGQSALTPVDPYSAGAASAPVDPYAALAAAAPVDPYRHLSAATPVDPRKGRSGALPTVAPSPRATLEPAWVFSSAEALLAQALRRSQAKVARPPDELLSQQERTAAAAGRTARGTHLWRWAPEFRVKTVASELLSRTHVHGAAVWYSSATLHTGALTIEAVPLFSLEDMPAIDMKEQIDKVVRAAVEREDRLPEVLAQSGGFWPFFERLLDFSLHSAPTLAELLAVGDLWIVHQVMALKHACHWKRPVQQSSLVMPVIATPGHGSMPSGHATVAAFQAELLRALMYPRDSLRSQQLDRLARRIAFNRVVGGVHFPVDNLVGYRLGTQLAQLFQAWAGARPHAPRAVSAADALAKGHTLAEADEVPDFRKGKSVRPGISNLRSLWDQAGAEITLLRG